jgi:hypothetical protein
VIYLFFYKFYMLTGLENGSKLDKNMAMDTKI